VHPRRWMRRNWTVGPKQTERAQCVDSPAVAKPGECHAIAEIGD